MSRDPKSKCNISCYNMIWFHNATISSDEKTLTIVSGFSETWTTLRVFYSYLRFTLNPNIYSFMPIHRLPTSLFYKLDSIIWNCCKTYAIFGSNKTRPCCLGVWLFCTSWFENKTVDSWIEGKDNHNCNKRKTGNILGRCI